MSLEEDKQSGDFADPEKGLTQGDLGHFSSRRCIQIYSFIFH